MKHSAGSFDQTNLLYMRNKKCWVEDIWRWKTAGGKSRKIIFACKTWFQPNCHILGICPEVLNWCHLQLKGLQSQFSIYWEIWDLLNAVFLFSSSKSFLKMLHFCKVNKQICCIICTDNPIHILPVKIAPAAAGPLGADVKYFLTLKFWQFCPILDKLIKSWWHD